MLISVSERDFIDYNSLIVFYLSHGDEKGLLHAKNGLLYTNEIWEAFSGNTSLKTKPKFFIFQVCGVSYISFSMSKVLLV